MTAVPTVGALRRVATRFLALPVAAALASAGPTLAQAPAVPAPSVTSSQVYDAMYYHMAGGVEVLGSQIVYPLTLGGVVVLTGCDAGKRCTALSFTGRLGPGNDAEVARLNAAGEKAGFQARIVLDPGRDAIAPSMRAQTSYVLNAALLPKLNDLSRVFAREGDDYRAMLRSSKGAN